MTFDSRRWAFVGFVPITIALLAASCESPPSVVRESPNIVGDPRATDEAERATETNLHGLGYLGSDGFTVWDDTEIRQSYGATNFREVSVLDEYLKAAPGDPASVAHSGASNFDFWCIESAGLDKYCVAGIGASGDFILERWELVPATVASRSEPAARPLVVTQSGEVLSKDFQKTRIFEGPLGVSVISVGFDPEERFMLALLTDDQGLTTIYKFDNVKGAVPIPVYDSITYPELATLGHFNRFDHKATLSRVWILSALSLYGDLQMMMFDDDNDGEFDGEPLIGNDEYFESVGYPVVFPYWDSLDGSGY